MTIAKNRPNDPIVSCEYVFPGEIASETRISENKVSINLGSGKVWKPIYFTPGSALLIEQESMPFGGRLFESKFDMKIPGDSADMKAELNRICGRSIVLKLTLESGATLVCGGRNRKLRLTASGTIGVSSGQVVGFSYQSKKSFNWLD